MKFHMSAKDADICNVALGWLQAESAAGRLEISGARDDGWISVDFPTLWHAVDWVADHDLRSIVDWVETSAGSYDPIDTMTVGFNLYDLHRKLVSNGHKLAEDISRSDFA